MRKCVSEAQQQYIQFKRLVDLNQLENNINLSEDKRYTSPKLLKKYNICSCY